jgi:putative PEP-CTERM system TPR-repeat lipoprotein
MRRFDLHHFFPLIPVLLGLAACGRSPQEKEAFYLKRGADLMAKRDYARALLEFRNAAAAMPRDAEPYYQLGSAYLGTGKEPLAIESFRKALSINPKHPGAQLRIAELMVASGNKETVETAAKQLQDLVSESPSNQDAAETLALAEWRLGHTADAARRLEASLERLPSHLRSSVALARIKISQHDYAGAREILKKAAAAAPDSAKAALALGQVYVLSGDLALAEQELNRAVRLDSTDGSALINLAMLQVARGRRSEAEETLRRVSAIPDRRYRPLHAIFLYENGQREAGIAELAKLANSDTADRSLSNLLFSAYVAAGRSAGAAALVDSALKRNPNDIDALLHKTELNRAAGKTGDAERDLRQILHFKPDSAEAHYLLAGLYKMQSRRATERQELIEALRFSPGLLPARIALARHYLLANTPAAALQVCNEAPDAQRSIPALIISRNWALLALGNTQEAAPAIEKALRAGANSDLLVQRATVKVLEHDYAGARDAANQVLKIDPGDARAARIIVEAYSAQKQLPQAIEKLRELATTRPASAPLQNLLGRSLIAAGNIEAAKSAFSAAIHANPKFSAAELALADIAVRQNQLDSAKAGLLRLIENDRTNSAALLMLAGVEARLGDRKSAIARCRAVLDFDSKNVVALNNIAYYMTAEDLDSALSFAQQAAEIMPNSAAVEDTLGWIYFRKGLYKMAVPYLEHAAAKEPTPRRKFHLSLCYLKMGDRKTGQPMLQAAIAQDPSLLNSDEARQ